MATSGSVNYADRRNDIIADAFRLAGVYGSSDSSIAAHDQQLAERFLNRMFKSWMADGIKLWKLSEFTLFLRADQVKYILGATDHASETVVETTLGGAEASGQTILTITSTTGMTASDNIGIELDSGDLQWTTISTVDSSTQVTVAASLTGAAASGNSVYSYTTRIARPYRIHQVRRRDKDGIDVLLNEISRAEYFSIAEKTNEGIPTSYYFDPQQSQAHIYIWPEPDNMDVRLKITATEQLEDFDASTDNPDVPNEWLKAVVYGLAVEVALVYGKLNELTLLKQLFDIEYQKVMNSDNSEVSLKFMPEL